MWSHAKISLEASLKYASRLGMESIGNYNYDYNETDFDCSLAEAVVATPIFTDGSRMPPEQPQPSQERVRSGDQPQSQASLEPLPPFRSLVNSSTNFQAEPRSRKVKLQERDPVQLRKLNEAKEARRKWREKFWLQEEQQKIKELFEVKNSAIFVLSDKAKRAEKELAKVSLQLAKFRKVVTNSEDRSRKVASANARMLKYISEKL